VYFVLLVLLGPMFTMKVDIRKSSKNAIFSINKPHLSGKEPYKSTERAQYICKRALQIDKMGSMYSFTMMVDIRKSHLQTTATHCNTLPHTAAHCSTLQHTAAHCSTLQHTATHCNTLQHNNSHYNTLQHTATHCNALQHTTTHYNTLMHTARQLLQHTTAYFKTLQHTTTHCNALQHTANTDAHSSTVAAAHYSIL